MIQQELGKDKTIQIEPDSSKVSNSNYGGLKLKSGQRWDNTDIWISIINWNTSNILESISS